MVSPFMVRYSNNLEEWVNAAALFPVFRSEGPVGVIKIAVKRWF